MERFLVLKCKEFFLDFGCQFQECHYLADSGSGNAHFTGYIGLGLDKWVLEEILVASGFQERRFIYPWELDRWPADSDKYSAISDFLVDIELLPPWNIFAVNRRYAEPDTI
ncbi:hypothetical protein HY768_06505 [candidate division TA06 bacterium]|uniref:Uncharacterized protein n=1 Tax=candidate division TA06 bacterium TaxID=2250710 RepID=A0A933MKM0_UNCT6|nr:hypothetical protein [candidate division TA06 bacterium]